MNKIVFPLLNLKITVANKAFTIFGIDIYWYAIIIVSAIIIALLICKKRNGLYDIKFENVLDTMIYTIPISILSARFYYIIFNLKFYLQNPKTILNFRTGGLAIYGAIIGGIITIAVITYKKKISFLDFLDYIAPALAIAQSIGRWGNFINIEAYGTKTILPWRMGIYEAGKYIEVHPTFLYESICTFVIFIILLKISKKRKFKGQITAIYLILYGLTRAIIEGLRADSLMLGQFRISQILSIIIVIVAITSYAVNINKGIIMSKNNKN